MPNLLIPFRFALGLAALLAGVWLVYAPGLNAAFRLDDFQNLGLLDQVVDLDTLLLFVTSGLGWSRAAGRWRSRASSSTRLRGRWIRRPS